MVKRQVDTYGKKPFGDVPEPPKPGIKELNRKTPPEDDEEPALDSAFAEEVRRMFGVTDEKPDSEFQLDMMANFSKLFTVEERPTPKFLGDMRRVIDNIDIERDNIASRYLQEESTE